VFQVSNQTIEGTNPAVKLFEGERWLALTGLLGVLLAGLCAVWVMLNGGPVSPYGDVSKAISFNAALGLFLLSTAAIIPLSALGVKSRAFFRWSYILLALYAYSAETVQNFRGVMLHGLGFHALQAVPFVAWLTERTSLTPPVRRRWIHLTGIAYLLGLTVIGWQTILGYSIFEWSALPLLAVGCFLIAFVPVVLMLRQATAIDKSQRLDVS
jgi:hypothetical protein